MPGTHALAVRGLSTDTIDWSVLYGMEFVSCMDADPGNARGKRPGIEAAWRLDDLLTARKIAAVIVDQSDWADDEYNDCNDIPKAGGADELKARLRKVQE